MNRKEIWIGEGKLGALMLRHPFQVRVVLKRERLKPRTRIAPNKYSPETKELQYEISSLPGWVQKMYFIEVGWLNDTDEGYWETARFWSETYRRKLMEADDDIVVIPVWLNYGFGLEDSLKRAGQYNPRLTTIGNDALAQLVEQNDNRLASWGKEILYISKEKYLT